MFTALLASLLLLTSCPKEVHNSNPPSTVPITQIDISEFKPFCRRESKHPLCRSSRGSKRITFQELQAIDRDLRINFTYRSDMAVHNRPDFWQSSQTCGDCEDYTLELARRLASLGFRGKDMVLMLWVPDPAYAHATLIINTVDKGWVEVGVGNSELPAKFIWESGVRRIAWIRMDGKRRIQSGPLPTE